MKNLLQTRNWNLYCSASLVFALLLFFSSTNNGEKISACNSIWRNSLWSIYNSTFCELEFAFYRASGVNQSENDVQCRLQRSLERSLFISSQLWTWASSNLCASESTVEQRQQIRKYREMGRQMFIFPLPVNCSSSRAEKIKNFVKCDFVIRLWTFVFFLPSSHLFIRAF